MSGLRDFNSWPSALQSIDWSLDGIIAFAADDKVDLLIPRLRPFKDGDRDQMSKNPHWEPVAIPTSLFSEDEVPIKDIAPFQIFSIGEEISASSAVRVEWSPPGLAKHRRCALAVLTSNLTLQIWASETDPKKPSSWQRVLIINDALDVYFKRMDESQHQAKGARRRLRSRIRAFSWSPAPCPSVPSCTVGTQMSWGNFSIAVANEENNVALISIYPPHEVLASNNSWSARVVTHFAVSPDSLEENGELGVFDEHIHQQRYVEHLAWGPWTKAGGHSMQSVLAYSTHKKVCARRITQHLQGGEDAENPNLVIDSDESSYEDVQLRNAGPMKWCPEVRPEGLMFLIIFSQEEVLCFSLSSKDPSLLECAHHHLDGIWDPISGIAFDTRQPDNIRMYFSSLLSTARTETTGLSLSSTELISLPSPAWQAQIQEGQAFFSAKHDLAGNAIAKTWGMAASPMGDLLATCFTLHPTDMVEYTTPNEQKTMIPINGMGGNGDLNFPRHGRIMNVTAEALLFSVRRWFENNSESDEEIPILKAKILESMLISFPPLPSESKARVAEEPSDNDGTADTNAQAMIEDFKKRVYYTGTIPKHRYDILISTVCCPDQSMDLQHLMITLRLANEIQTFPRWLSENSPLSQTILANVSLVVSKLQDISQNRASEAADPEVERCDMCDSTVKLESLDWARCARGHQFSRCGLTFLAIQAPSISKYCSICGKQFLSEDFAAFEDWRHARHDKPAGRAEDVGSVVSEDCTESRNNQVPTDNDANVIGTGTNTETGGGNEASRPSTTLAQILFAACDVCIYCGGKYIG